MTADGPNPEERRANAPLDDAEVRDRVERPLSRMTVEEKVGQITQYFDFLTAPDDARRVEAEVAAGRAGSLLFVSDPVEINRLQRIAVEKTRLGVPLLFGFDVIHGFRTAMPVPPAPAATWDPEIVERTQAVAAAEARAVGPHWAFAPMVDIARDPRWGRMIEGAGEDPHLGSVTDAGAAADLETHGYAPGQAEGGRGCSAPGWTWK